MVGKVGLHVRMGWRVGLRGDDSGMDNVDVEEIAPVRRRWEHDGAKHKEREIGR